MKDLIEIRWHARAGQGAVTGAKMLAECAINEGRYAQAMPEYGPERSGAPIKAFNRISRFPIRIHSHVIHPNILIFLDASLLYENHHFDNCSTEAIAFVNSPLSPVELQDDLRINHCVFYTLDANKISRESTGISFPNLPILGALAHITQLVRIETLKSYIQENFREKIGEENLERYFRAVEKGYIDAIRGS